MCIKRVYQIKLSSHRFKMKKKEKIFFFTQCIIKLRNSLPQDVVEARSINGLKKQLEKFLAEKFIERYKTQRCR